ncbi:hypothetical protein Tco_0091573 [Tanacetum coccineum]
MLKRLEEMFKRMLQTGGMMDQGEDFGIERDSNKSTDKGSESTGEMANVLSSMGAANILASGGLKEVFTTASPPVPPVSLFVPTVAATASEKDSTAAVITTTTAVTPYTRRTRASRGVVMTSSSPIPINIPSISKEDKGKGIMTEPAKPTKQKVQEQMSEQLARELEEEFAQENQRLREQAARDAEIARLHTEGELKMMIDELDRSNEVIAKHLKEYAQAEDVLSLEDKIELITELAKYQKDLAQIKKYQAQQSKLASKTDRRKFYTSVLRSHAGWKTKDFKGMTFKQIEETFIPVWESIQDFVPMDSKLESERFKRPGTLLEKERAKRLKIVEGSEQQSEGNKDVKEKDSDDHDKIINLQQWVVLVRQESSVDITPSVVKAPIYDWKIFKDKLREEFDRDDMVTLWKLVKDRFKEELPKSDLEKCLFWPLKVMFEPVATDGLWKFKAPIKNQFEEEVAEAMGEPSMEEYMTKTREYYGSGIARPKIDEKAKFELKGCCAKKAIQDMADHSEKWNNGTSTRTRNIDTSDGLAAIQAQLNNLGRKIKKCRREVMAKFLEWSSGQATWSGGQDGGVVPKGL